METHSNIVKAIGVVAIFAAGYGTKCFVSWYQRMRQTEIIP